MPSFDVVMQANKVELNNAVMQTQKQIDARFDLKGSSSLIEYSEKDHIISMYADNEFQLGQVRNLLLEKMSKRSVDLRFFHAEKIESISGGKVKQNVTIKNGVPSDLAKKIIQHVKTSKLKVQATIQGDSVRVSGGKRDDLQLMISQLKSSFQDEPLGFENYRD